MNVRTRALCAFMIPFGDIAGGFLTGYFLDEKRLSIKQRARWSFGVLMTLNLALWVWTAIVTKQLEDTRPVIDWTSPMFGRTFILFVLFDMATMATQTSLFWIISHSIIPLMHLSQSDGFVTVSDDFIALSYMTGTLRGVECAGQAVAYGIKSTDTTDWLSIGLNIGLSTSFNLVLLFMADVVQSFFRFHSLGQLCVRLELFNSKRLTFPTLSRRRWIRRGWRTRKNLSRHSIYTSAGNTEMIYLVFMMRSLLGLYR